VGKDQDAFVNNAAYRQTLTYEARLACLIHELYKIPVTSVYLLKIFNLPHHASVAAITLSRLDHQTAF
jgi:hypothetical protein